VAQGMGGWKGIGKKKIFLKWNIGSLSKPNCLKARSLCFAGKDRFGHWRV